MRILITGASGFLGRHLCKKLEHDHEVTALSSKNCDLTDSQSLKEFASIPYDCIYHLAAWTQAGDFCLFHPGEQWLINQKINTNLLDFWARYQPQAKLICMGTSCGYDPDVVLEENNYLIGKPIDSLFTYAMTKRMLLTGCSSLNKQYGLNYLYAIPSTLYGPGYHTDGRQLHFIFDLIRKILRGKLFNEPVILWGNGKQKRELIHVEDFITALLNIVESQNNCVINIGSGKEFSIKEFAQVICNYVDYPFEKIQFDETKHVGAKSKVLNITKLQALFPKFHTRPLDQGIAETIDWYYSAFFQDSPTLALGVPIHKCVAALD